MALDEAHRQEILRLATDFPAVWQDPRTPARERKPMAALLLEDVTVRRGDQVTLHVRFRGGTATTLTVPRPLTAWERRRTSPAVLTTIDALLTDHTDAEVAALLNTQALTTGAGQLFTGDRVKWLRAAKGLPSLRHRLRAAHLLTAKELATALGVSYDTVKVWRRQGRLHARRCNDKGEWLYAPRTSSQSSACVSPPRRSLRPPAIPPHHEQEVQYDVSSFGIDVLACAHCGGRLRLIATLHDPAVIRKILAHLALSHSGQSPGPAPPESGAAAS